jgi:hypothetical protein
LVLSCLMETGFNPGLVDIKKPKAVGPWVNVVWYT